MLFLSLFRFVPAYVSKLSVNQKNFSSKDLLLQGCYIINLLNLEEGMLTQVWISPEFPKMEHVEFRSLG
jgi:hypothetical protein